MLHHFGLYVAVLMHNDSHQPSRNLVYFQSDTLLVGVRLSGQNKEEWMCVNCKTIYVITLHKLKHAWLLLIIWSHGSHRSSLSSSEIDH